MIYVIRANVSTHHPIVGHGVFYLVPVNLNFHDVTIKNKNCDRPQNLIKRYLCIVGGRREPKILASILASWYLSNVDLVQPKISPFPTRALI